MRVLKIIHTLGHGGAENTFRWLSWGLRLKGVEVIAAIPISYGSDLKKENWLAPALDGWEVPYLTFDTTGSPWQLLKNIVAVVRKVKPDIVHSHLLDSNFYSSLACRALSVPHVCTEHGDVALEQTAVSRVKYGMISGCSRSIICVSDAIRKASSGVMLFKRKLKTIYNGVRFLENSHSSFRREFQIPDDAVVIGNVGNLYPVKGQKYLVKAFAELYHSWPSAFLVLVGRGGEEKNLRQLAGELKLPPNRVLFTGFRNDIENVMNAFDLYVQPSLSEGHPLAVIEAMSLGIPVIATAVGGIPEVTRADRYGTLVAPRSSEGLYRSMRDYLQEKKEFCRKASAAKVFVRVEFSIEKMVCNYMNCYLEALVKGRS